MTSQTAMDTHVLDLEDQIILDNESGTNKADVGNY